MQLPLDQELTALGRAIQMAIAPVFLLSGVAAFLNVLNTRLMRVVDRTRLLENTDSDTTESGDDVGRELKTLMKRRRVINRAITLCTTCALAICMLIMLMFLGTVVHVPAAEAVAVLFVVSMAALIGALLSFLAEIQMAVRFIRRSSPPRG